MVDMNGFDANNVPPAAGFEPLPADAYRVTITASENKQTRAGNGSYLKLELTVADGQYIGRKVWANLNLDNPNAQAVEIAKAELSSICRAVGVMTPRDSIELHNLPLMAKVVVEKRNDNGELSNVIKGYASIANAPASAPPTPVSAVAPPADTPPYAPQAGGPAGVPPVPGPGQW